MPTGLGEAVTNKKVGVSYACVGAINVTDNVISRIKVIVASFVFFVNNVFFFMFIFFITSFFSL